jgi:type IV pilus assembly protein PilC
MAAKAEKRYPFTWEGLDKKGKRTTGEINATNAIMAKAELRRQGINPLKVSKKPVPLFGGGKGKKGGRKIITKDIAIFARQLATMMASGVPLVQSFEIIAKGADNPNMRDLVLNIKGDIEGGLPMAEALRRHPEYFDKLTCNLIHAGEQAGILEDLLNKIATYKEKTEAIKSKVKKALTYPIAIVIVAFAVAAILLIFVVPQFESLFAGFGADLPGLTKLVIEMSDFLVAWWWAVFGALGIAGYSFKVAVKNSLPLQNNLQRLSLRLPIVGPILNYSAIARFSRTLSTMFAAGVPLVEAMDSVAGAVDNIVYQTAVHQIRDQVSAGTSLTEAMEAAGVFPNMVVQMTSIGEEAGSVDAMLGKVADFYEAEVDNMVDALSSLMEPMIMAFLGGMIGTLVIAMYLPIFKMGDAI